MMIISHIISYTLFSSFFLSHANDVPTMLKLRASLLPAPPPSWTASDSYCTWSGVECDTSSLVTSINLASKSLTGTLPSNLSALSRLTTLSLQNNRFNGQIPLLANLDSLRGIHLDSNDFTSVPAAAFQNLSGLQTLTLSHNPYLSPWIFPDVTSSPNLTVFEAINTTMRGNFPSLIWQSNLQVLRLSHNKLAGPIWEEPSDYKFKLHTLWLDNQETGFSGSIDFIRSMKQLAQVWLDHNKFSGPIPDLSNSTNFFDLQLSDNQLSGIVPPSLASLPNLLNISLQNNKFFGPLPDFSANVNFGNTSDFCSDKPGVACDEQVTALLNVMVELGSPEMSKDSWRDKDPCKWKFIGCNKDGNVTVVDLSGHQFQGYIPTNLGNVTALIDLYLNDNGFVGGIPDSFTQLPNLKLLDVSGNYLTGMIPEFRSSVRVNVNGNMLVENGSLFRDVSTSIEGIQNSSFISLTHSRSKSGMKVKTLVSVCVVVVVVVAVATLTISTVLWLLSKKRKQVNGSEEDSAGELGGFLRRFSYENLKSVTGNFDQRRKLGSGGFGSVYEGNLADGSKVAVKHLDRLGQGRKEFVAEVKTLGSIHHVNLVKLIGFCDENAHRLLVYEHMSNGSLDKWIFQRKENPGSSLLSWCTRRRIILQIAKGLAYLHEECQHRIAHLDIKPQNILLDQNFNAKVADFGLAKLIDKDESLVMTQMRGTRGYLAPEWLSRKITEKADVYSFGVVLLEVVYGRKNLDYYKYLEDDDDEEEVDSGNDLLVHLVKRKAEKNQLLDLVEEPYQGMDDANGEEIEKMVKFAICCLHEDPTRRPSMSNVVKALEGQMDMMLMEFKSTYHSNSIDSCLVGSSSSSSRQGDSSSVPNSVLSGPR